MTTLPDSALHGRKARLRRLRVLVLLPDLAASHDAAIRAEIASLERDYEVAVITHTGASTQGLKAQAIELERLREGIEAFGPEVLHAHGLGMLGPVGRLAQASGIPFTLRAHARDSGALRPLKLRQRVMQTLRRERPTVRSAWFAEAHRAAERDQCLGVLTLPFTRPWLRRAGLPGAKLVDCFPALRFADFHDRSPNGDAVMGIAGSGPRAVHEMLRLAAKVPGRTVNLHAPVALAESLRSSHAALSTGVNIVGPRDAAAMPGEYKRHRWLVLTAGDDAAVADWPLAIAEAQAAGVGVCMPALRPDLARFVGEGAGILYETIDELPAIISAPVPEEMRERGFVQARKSDIEGHRHLLTNLWHDALSGRLPDRQPPADARPKARADNPMPAAPPASVTASAPGITSPA
jgi:hypothetical protein